MPKLHIDLSRFSSPRKACSHEADTHDRQEIESAPAVGCVIAPPEAQALQRPLSPATPGATPVIRYEPGGEKRQIATNAQSSNSTVMKNKKAKTADSNGHTGHRVRLEIDHLTAAVVSIAGTFNDWRPEATPMVSLGKGRWLKELVLPAGTYEYRFVVDGQWVCDPLAKETAPNPFGSKNSVLRVPPEAQATRNLLQIAIPIGNGKENLGTERAA
jgi:Glycogen recognition site of AMP-activated protein kinase